MTSPKKRTPGGRESKDQSPASRDGVSYAELVHELYLGILGRPVDDNGLATYLHALRNGESPANIVRALVNSEEFTASRETPSLGRIELPDLTRLYPEKYIRVDADMTVFRATSDDDFRFMQSLITKYRYYESYGVWAPIIDLDKRVTAAIVRGLGAQSILELGCFTGPVLSVLAEQGVEVCGVEISHLAFTLAYANVHERIRYGDLLELEFDRTYDVFLGMDILEHLNPLDLGEYISKIASLVKPGGFVYINSPMFGTDDVYGTVFTPYLEEWVAAGEEDFWRYMHCDAKGWPMHGHLVWASPKWWENLFREHGLVRERSIERGLHGILARFFDQVGPGRRGFFVLRHSDTTPDVDATLKQLDRALSPLLADL